MGTMFVDENIDGELFLSLLDDSDLLKDLNVSAGGKAKIRIVVRVSPFITYALFLLMRQCNVFMYAGNKGWIHCI